MPGEHARLTITAEADVSTDAQGEPPASGSEAIRAPRYTDAGGEFLLSTGDEPENGALGDLIQGVRGEDPRAALLRVCEAITDASSTRRAPPSWALP